MSEMNKPSSRLEQGLYMWYSVDVFIVKTAVLYSVYAVVHPRL